VTTTSHVYTNRSPRASIRLEDRKGDPRQAEWFRYLEERGERFRQRQRREGSAEFPVIADVEPDLEGMDEVNLWVEWVLCILAIARSRDDARLRARFRNIQAAMAKMKRRG
jgi:hypothetical protein